MTCPATTMTGGKRTLADMDNLPINAVDIIAVLVLLISGVLAYVRGFVHEILAIGGWVGAFFATVSGYPHLQPYARELIPTSELLADFGAGMTIFVISLVILTLVTRAISTRVQESGMNVLDRSLGFLFGLIRGIVVICIAYIGLEFLVPRDEQPAWVTEARSLPLMVEGATVLTSLMPENTRVDIPEIRSRAENVKDIMDIVQPSPDKSADAGADDGAYTDEERQRIEQLIENSQ